MINILKRTISVGTISALIVIVASGCSHTSSSETTANFSIETDEGKKDYSYNSDVTASVGTENGLEVDGNVATNTTDTTNDETVEEAVDEAVLDAGRYIDELLSNNWDDEDSDHRVTCDDDEIYVQIWNEGLSYADNIDEEEFQNNVIPFWLTTVEEWRTEVDKRGLNNVEICMQYISDIDDTAFFTIEGGVVTYNVFEEEN